MASESRAVRVAELVKHEIANMLIKGLKDPRIGFVSVMGVRMSTDLRYAKVYVSLYGEDKEKKSSLIALQNSSGWVRRELGRNLKLRLTPEVRFFEDTSLEEVYRLENVLQELNESEQDQSNDPVETKEISENE
jgi:ribosome-binding factor A